MRPSPAPPAADPAEERWTPLWQWLLSTRLGPSEALEPAPPHPPDAAAQALLQLYMPLVRARRECQRHGVAHNRPVLAASGPSAPVAAAASAAPRPWVVAQLGQSLDGCVATAAGDSFFVTGEQSLLHLHRLRALCDAVLVGAGTVAADDPQLTTRRVPGPNPLRLVLDPTARLDGQARVLREPAAPTLWICDASHAARARACRPHGGAEVLAVDGLLTGDGPAAGIDIGRLLDTLGECGVALLFVEGGGVTVSRFLAAGAIDRLHLVVAPVLIGDGRRGIQGPGPARMAECPRPPVQRLLMGEDVLFDLDLSRSGSG